MSSLAVPRYGHQRYMPISARMRNLPVIRHPMADIANPADLFVIGSASKGMRREKTVAGYPSFERISNPSFERITTALGPQGTKELILSIKQAMGELARKLSIGSKSFQCRRLQTQKWYSCS